MKELHGQASATAPAPRDRCFALLRAVDRYPDWYPEVVRRVEVVQRDASGQPTQVRTELHVEHGPMVKDFDLLMAVSADAPERVTLTRMAEGRSDQRFDVAWRLQDGGRTRIALDLSASIDVPRFLPLGGVGDSIAQGFVAAATRALESGNGTKG